MQKNSSMQVLWVSSWTQTPGAGSDIIRKLDFPKTSADIVSFAEFKTVLRDEEQEMHLERLEDVKFQLEEIYTGNTDPIHFLYHQYYVEFLSLRDISKRLEEMFSVTYPVTSLRGLFDLLWWERRENFDEENPITAKKNSAKVKNGALGERVKQRQEKIQSKIEELTALATPKNFSQKEFERKTAKYKVSYLIEVLFGCSMEQLIAQHFEGFSLLSVGKVLKATFTHAISSFWWDIENPLPNERKLSDMIQWSSYSEDVDKPEIQVKDTSKSIKVLHEKIKQRVGTLVTQQDGKTYSFNMREYNALKKDSAQATYILKAAWVIQESLDEIIENLKTEFEAPSIATIINTLCKEFLLLMTIFDEDSEIEMKYPNIQRQTILFRLAKMKEKKDE